METTAVIIHGRDSVNKTIIFNTNMAYPRNFSDLELVKYLEQIEAVQFQLKNNSIIGARIALFLLDSLADIITYYSVSISPYSPYDLDDLRKNDQIRKNFLERVKVMYITDTQYQFIVEMRRLRNEAFHEAKLREDEVIICLVKIYYQIIRDMIKGFMLYPGDYQYDVIVNYNHENINHWEEQKLLKYIESKGLLNKFVEYEHITYEELIETVLSQYELETDKIYYQRINQILSNDLIKRIDILNEMIIYEINSLRSSKIRQEELEKLLNDEPVNPRDDKPISEKDIDDFLQYIKDECAMGNISKKQIDNWKVQAKDLINEREIHDTLRKWGEIDRKLSKLSNIGLLFNIAKANEGKIKVQFKGNIQIKTTPENHQKISLAAEKSSMDINSWINKVLTNAVEKFIDS